MANSGFNHFRNFRERFGVRSCCAYQMHENCGATAGFSCPAISAQINQRLFVENIEFQAQHGNSEQQECSVSIFIALNSNVRAFCFLLKQIFIISYFSFSSALVMGGPPTKFRTGAGRPAH